MTIAELKAFAIKNKIKVPSNLNKKPIAEYIFKKLHPKAKDGL